MQLLAINSVSMTDDPTALIVNCRLVDSLGIEEDVDYILRFDDPYGLAPAIRQAIGWTDPENPPSQV